MGRLEGGGDCCRVLFSFAHFKAGEFLQGNKPLHWEISPFLFVGGLNEMFASGSVKGGEWATTSADHRRQPGFYAGACESVLHADASA